MFTGKFSDVSPFTIFLYGVPSSGKITLVYAHTQFLMSKIDLQEHEKSREKEKKLFFTILNLFRSSDPLLASRLKEFRPLRADKLFEYLLNLGNFHRSYFFATVSLSLHEIFISIFF